MGGNGEVRSRAIAPRSARVVALTTEEVREALEERARSRGWTLSLTAHLALIEGLKVWGVRIDEGEW